MTKDGFNEAHVTGVEVNIASSSTVKIQMKAGASAQSVKVLATALLINAYSPVFSIEVPKEIADKLPFLERSALATVMLAPGVQGDSQYNMGVQIENALIFKQPTTPGASLSVGGGRPGSALHFVDGVDLSVAGIREWRSLFQAPTSSRFRCNLLGSAHAMAAPAAGPATRPRATAP